MNFVDEIEIYVKAGNGGKGCVSFYRAPFIPKGGPDGGNGGKGGNIFFEVHNNLNTLSHYRKHKKYFAENGKSGGGNNKTGANGENLVLKVPPGTIIKDDLDNVIVDLTTEKRVILLEGGKGGKGNNYFKNSVNQSPGFSQEGKKTYPQKIKLELKIIADVGIVGFPNAGKSTLISTISRAKPKIADYPFTTLLPNIGIVDYFDDKSFSVADIPGLISGASQGKGLGIRFLKHIERTKVLIFLLNGENYLEKNISATILEEYLNLFDELKKYDEIYINENPLHLRKRFIVINKVDLLKIDEKYQIERYFKKNKYKDIFFISSINKEGLKELICELGRILFDQ